MRCLAVYVRSALLVVMENKSEIRALIADLGLVRVGSLQDREFLQACRLSRFTRYHFCDRWKDWKKSRFELSSCLHQRSRKPSISHLPSLDQFNDRCVLPL